VGGGGDVSVGGGLVQMRRDDDDIGCRGLLNESVNEFVMR
jgi:hypothetical protein